MAKLDSISPKRSQEPQNQMIRPCMFVKILHFTLMLTLGKISSNKNVQFVGLANDLIEGFQTELSGVQHRYRGRRGASHHWRRRGQQRRGEEVGEEAVVGTRHGHGAADDQRLRPVVLASRCRQSLNRPNRTISTEFRLTKIADTLSDTPP